MTESNKTVSPNAEAPSKKIPTNIITGFLGAGKTTAIRHLLKTKPADENWAVLVNEFGEVGIDGAMLNADGIAVKEVVGGCICCSVRVPSRVALVRLIQEHKPDRIIIEPTGLALPKQIMNMLSTPEFLEILDMQAIVCLLEANNLKDTRYLATEAFTDQIASADVVIATKADISDADELIEFEQYMGRLEPAKQAIATIADGEMDWRLLTHPHLASRALKATGSHPLPSQFEQERNLPAPDDEGVVRIENSAGFGVSCGWQFTDEWRFDRDKLQTLFQSLKVPRIKGIFATKDGWLIINKMRDTLKSEYVEKAADSRVEMLALDYTYWMKIDKQIRACREV